MKKWILGIIMWALVLSVLIVLYKFTPVSYFKTPRKEIFYLCKVLFSLWLILSSFIFIYWHFKQKWRIHNYSKSTKIDALVWLGTFFCCIFILSSGMKALLFFIPDSFGQYIGEGYDTFEPYKDSISNAFGFLTTCFLVYVYGKFQKKGGNK